MQQLYLVELETEETLTFQYVPEKISLRSGTQLAEIMAVGRNLPIVMATGGEETLNLVMEFYAKDTLRQEAVKKANWLKSLRYGGSGQIVTPRLQLIWGQMFHHYIWTMKEVQIDYSLFQENNDYLPQIATCNIQLSAVYNGLSRQQVRKLL